MAFDLKEAQTSVVLKNKEIVDLNAATTELKLALNAKKDEAAEEKKKGLNYLSDYDKEKKRADDAVKKADRGKVGLWIAGAVAVLETIYIGVKAAMK